MKRMTYELVFLPLAVLMLDSCDHEKPIAPKQSPVASFFPHTVGSYWIYTDTTYDKISSQVILATIDSIAVVGVHYDSLGTWAVLNHWLSWVSDTFMVKGDTLFSRELGYVPEPGPVPIFTSAQYVPGRDTPFVYNVFHEDVMERRTAERLDTPLVCGAGSFDQCILFYDAEAFEIVYHDILAPNVGLVYSSWEVTPMGRPDIDQLTVRRLLRYHIAH